MKKILAVVLAIVMLLPVFAVNSVAADPGVYLEVGPDVSTLFDSDSIDVTAGGDFSLSITVDNPIDFTDAATFLAIKSAGVTLTTGTVFAVNSVRLNGTEVALNSNLSKTVSENSIDYVLKLVCYGLGNIFADAANLPKDVTSVQVDFSVTVPEPDPVVPGDETPVELIIGSIADGVVVDGVASPTTDKDRFSIKLPETVALGKSIKLHIVGECDEAFRFWLANGWSGNAVIQSSSVGIGTGSFDFTYEFFADNCAAVEIIFGADPAGGTFNSFKLKNLYIVVEEENPDEIVLFSLGKKVLSDPWGDGFIIKEDKIADFVKACQTPGAELRLVYSVTEDIWCNFNINGNGNTYVDGSVSGDTKRTGLGAGVPNLINMNPGQNKKIIIGGADFLAYFTNQEGEECKGLWSSSGNTNVGDIYHGFDDVNNIASVQIQPAKGDIFTLESLKVVTTAAAMETPIMIRSIFKDKIALEYKVDLPSTVTNPVMQFKVNDVTTYVYGSTTPYGEEPMPMLLADTDTTTWYFVFAGVIPADLAAPITAKVSGSDVEIPTVSVLDYCAGRLSGSADTTFKPLISELVRDASSANKLNGGEGITADGMLNVAAGAAYTNRFDNTGDAWKGATLVLDNTITMRLYWNGDVAPAITDVQAGDHTVTINTEKKCVEISGFTPLDYDDIVTAKIGDSTITYSVGSYIERMSVYSESTEITKEICTCLRNYGRAAEAYAAATKQN